MIKNLKQVSKSERFEKFKHKVNQYGPIIKTVVVTELVFIIIFSVLLANCLVPTSSMSPTIAAGSRVIADRLVYTYTEPQRSDVIAFKFPDYEKVVFCKRVVGLPGEILEIKDGVVFIDNNALSEPYVVNDFTGNYGPFYIPKKGDKVEIKNTNGVNMCVINGFYVGKNIKEFLDQYCIEKNNEYIIKENCYFCLGDNRNNSEDARFWKNKFVTKNKIVGKMFFNFSKLSAVK